VISGQLREHHHGGIAAEWPRKRGRAGDTPRGFFDAFSFYDLQLSIGQFSLTAA
jgi:hypothetical protein